MDAVIGHVSTRERLQHGVKIPSQYARATLSVGLPCASALSAKPWTKPGIVLLPHISRAS